MYDEQDRFYVPVTAYMREDGIIRPLKVEAYGKTFHVDNIFHVYPTQIEMGDNTPGSRYDVKINGKPTELYRESSGRWFADRRVFAGRSL